MAGARLAACFACMHIIMNESIGKQQSDAGRASSVCLALFAFCSAAEKVATTSSKRRRKVRSASPLNFPRQSAPFLAKKAIGCGDACAHAPASARAARVFPVPGSPWNKMPLLQQSPTMTNLPWPDARDQDGQIARCPNSTSYIPGRCDAHVLKQLWVQEWKDHHLLELFDNSLQASNRRPVRQLALTALILSYQNSMSHHHLQSGCALCTS
jgi:hypothetical protein